METIKPAIILTTDRVTFNLNPPNDSQPIIKVDSKVFFPPTCVPEYSGNKANTLLGQNCRSLEPKYPDSRAYQEEEVSFNLKSDDGTLFVKMDGHEINFKSCEASYNTSTGFVSEINCSTYFRERMDLFLGCALGVAIIFLAIVSIKPLRTKIPYFK